MAVENTRVFEQVKFDGDWPKAGAIDTAMHYASYMIDELKRRMTATAQGLIGIPPAYFTEITALFEAVLNKQGYVIVPTESLDDLNRKVQKLISISQQNVVHYAEVQEKLSQREKELDQALATIEKLRDTTSLLRDEQNSGNSEPEQRGTFAVSRCPTPYPYSPTGEPCVYNTFHLGNRHASFDDELWNEQVGLTEDQARLLKNPTSDNSANSESEQRDTFVISPCLLSNSYSPTGKPCVISFYHGATPHFSSEREEIWSNDAGLNVEQARELKEFNKRHDSEE